MRAPLEGPPEQHTTRARVPSLRRRATRLPGRMGPPRRRRWYRLGRARAERAYEDAGPMRVVRSEVAGMAQVREGGARMPTLSALTRRREHPDVLRRAGHVRGRRNDEIVHGIPPSSRARDESVRGVRQGSDHVGSSRCRARHRPHRGRRCTRPRNRLVTDHTLGGQIAPRCAPGDVRSRPPRLARRRVVRSR